MCPSRTSASSVKPSESELAPPRLAIYNVPTVVRRPLDVIIDTDPGIDDACALLAALASRRLRVRAVIATGGNVPARQAVKNVRRVLAVARPEGVPLLGLGLDAPGKGLDATRVHGPDGLARASVTPAKIPAQDASQVVTQVLTETDGNVALLALAPLTTVRWLFDQVPDFRARVAQVVVMGGALAVPGNVSPVAEFNFWRDPEAAAAVVRMGLPLRLVPLDVTERWEVTADDLRRRLTGRSRRQRFLRHLLRYAVRTHEKLLSRGASVHDLVALAALLRPGLFRWQPTYLDVETRGILTRGMVVAEGRPHIKRRPNVSVALGVRTRALGDFLWGLLQ